MTTNGIQNVKNDWRTFLMNAELAKNYKMANMIAGFGQPAAPNPILEALLPSLLFVRLGSLLDDIFEEYITEKTLVMGNSYRGDLNGRINYLIGQGLLQDGPRLHALRQKRNELAHEASRSCTWKELEEAVALVDTELQHLGLVGTRPQYEFYAERTPRPKSEPGYVLTFDYCYGLKAAGEKAIEVSWTVHYGGE